MADELATPAQQPQPALVVDARNIAGVMPDDAIELADLVVGERLRIAGISAADASAGTSSSLQGGWACVRGGCRAFRGGG